MLKKTILTAVILAVCLLAGSALNLRIAQAQGGNSIINPEYQNELGTPYETGEYTLNDFVITAIGASRWILGLVGALALAMFIYGGILFLLSAGSSDKIGQAKKIIVAAVIGLIIVFASYLIIKFVLASLGLNWQGTTETMTPVTTLTANRA